MRIVALLIALAVTASASVAGARYWGSDAPASAQRPGAKVPRPAALRDAWAHARARGGQVSFAVVDTEVVPTAEAEPDLPADTLRGLRLFRVDECLRVRHASQVSPA